MKVTTHRELDALVWLALHPDQTQGEAIGDKAIVMRNDRQEIMAYLTGAGRYGREVPNYSTTWGGLGLVVEAMASRGLYRYLHYIATDDKPRLFGVRFGDHEAESETELVATCLAVLKSVGVEVEWCPEDVPCV